MDGMKSGTGDDLWAEDDEEPTEDEQPATDTGDAVDDSTPADATAASETNTEETGDDGAATSDAERPYVVRRAIAGGNTQFERPNRLTFFVHDDVARAETELEQAAEEHFDTSIPTFDLREAAYREALANQEGVFGQLSRMGYEED